MTDRNNPRTVIAVDPGRSKCGVVVVRSPPLEVLDRAIVPTENLVVDLSRRCRADEGLTCLVIGNGTGSSILVKAVKAALPFMEIHVVEEHKTSELARKRYLAEHAPRGWELMIPRAFRSPASAYDDYAALILAEAFLNSTANS